MEHQCTKRCTLVLSSLVTCLIMLTFRLCKASMWLWALVKIDADVLLCCDVVAGELRCIILSDLEKSATAVLTKISFIVLEV
jgi:hypothetical protein